MATPRDRGLGQEFLVRPGARREIRSGSCRRYNHLCADARRQGRTTYAPRRKSASLLAQGYRRFAAKRGAVGRRLRGDLGALGGNKARFLPALSCAPPFCRILRIADVMRGCPAAVVGPTSVVRSAWIRSPRRQPAVRRWRGRRTAPFRWRWPMPTPDSSPTNIETLRFAVPGLEKPAEILVDRWGIPHLQGPEPARCVLPSRLQRGARPAVAARPWPQAGAGIARGGLRARLPGPGPGGAPVPLSRRHGGRMGRLRDAGGRGDRRGLRRRDQRLHRA